MAHETTLYSVLRVPENATPEELKQAYRKLVKLWHPDLHPDDMSAEKRMAEINEAYTVLSDPAKKLKYDNSLSSKRAAQRAKEEEQARKAARAAAAAAAAKAAANAGARAGSGAAPVKKPYNDPDRPVRTDSSYEDFTNPASSFNNRTHESPFVVNNAGQSSAPAKRSDTGATEELTPGEMRLENISVALCVLFPAIIPVVYKHMKESLEIYPYSRHYRDSLTSLKIITIFAIPLWLLLIFLIVKGVLGI